MIKPAFLVYWDGENITKTRTQRHQSLGRSNKMTPRHANNTLERQVYAGPEKRQKVACCTYSKPSRSTTSYRIGRGKKMQFDIEAGLGVMFFMAGCISGVGSLFALANLSATCDDPYSTPRDRRNAFIILIIVCLTATVSIGLSAGFLGE